MDIFTLVGGAGLLLISTGVITKNRTKQNILYIIGGIFLGIYSAYLENMIFIILQLIFVLSAIYDLWRIRNCSMSHQK
ncbi:MAG: hypothetical protein KC736_00345 [Candidatus Moranbacteria bacterium]|nr:hypothetical protein [Candidatus Moranbacteria bacterium]